MLFFSFLVLISWGDVRRFYRIDLCKCNCNPKLPVMGTVRFNVGVMISYFIYYDYAGGNTGSLVRGYPPFSHHK